ncbi:MAG: STAS domain-containing protein [Phycisphaerae bacterium]|nr:STAS domain-containing protein [Phycisphaerae bacterium]
MSAAAARINVRHRDTGVLQIGFAEKRISDALLIQQIGDEIGKAVDAETKPRVLLSFRNVDFLSSAALSMLIGVNTRVRAKGGKLRLSEIKPEIYQMFKITKLHSLFEIFDSVDEAVKGF